MSIHASSVVAMVTELQSRRSPLPGGLDLGVPSGRDERSDDISGAERWTVIGDDPSNLHVVLEGAEHMRVCFLTSNGPTEQRAALIAAAPDLLAAAKIVLAGLHEHIDAAPKNAVPLFDGIADLHDAIGKATAPVDEVEEQI